MKTLQLAIFMAILMVANTFNAYTQSLLVCTPGLDDFCRRAQSTANTDSSVSYKECPVFPEYISRTVNLFYHNLTFLNSALSYGNNLAYKEDAALQKIATF